MKGINNERHRDEEGLGVSIQGLRLMDDREVSSEPGRDSIERSDEIGKGRTEK